MYYYDKAAADRVISFIENRCYHPDSGKKFILEKFQKDLICDAFAWHVKKTGVRKHKFVYFEVPKGNGKSRFLSAIGLYLLCYDMEKGAEIYVCAGDRSQAGIIFDDCKEMVKADEQILGKRLKTFKSTITHEKSGSSLKAISAEAYSKHGYRPHGILFDELHVQPNRELYDTLTKGVMKKPRPMVWMITTAGKSGSFGHDMANYARDLRDGKKKNPFWLVRVYAADHDDDPFSPKTWKKANPGYGTIIKPDAFLPIVTEAKSLPSGLNSFLQLHLNLWTGTEKTFIADHEWQKCDFGTIDPKELEGKKCYAGLDLASTRDLTALCFFFPDVNGKHYAIWKIYCPDETILARDKKENASYSDWVRKGWITTTPGNSTDYSFIKRDYLKGMELYDIERGGYDRWNSSQLIGELTDEGANMVGVGQGYRSMNEAMNAVELMVLKKNLNHGGNPVVRWCTGNVVVDKDASGNRKPSKEKSKEKIDPFVALLNAVYEYNLDFSGNKTSVYEMRGVINY